MYSISCGSVDSGSKTERTFFKQSNLESGLKTAKKWEKQGEEETQQTSGVQYSVSAKTTYLEEICKYSDNLFNPEFSRAEFI